MLNKRSHLNKFFFFLISAWTSKIEQRRNRIYDVQEIMWSGEGCSIICSYPIIRQSQNCHWLLRTFKWPSAPPSPVAPHDTRGWLTKSHYFLPAKAPISSYKHQHLHHCSRHSHKQREYRATMVLYCLKFIHILTKTKRLLYVSVKSPHPRIIKNKYIS